MRSDAKEVSRIAAAGTFSGGSLAVNVLTLTRIRKKQVSDSVRRLVAGAPTCLVLCPRDAASETEKNGPRLRKDAWFLYKVKVKKSVC